MTSGRNFNNFPDNQLTKFDVYVLLVTGFLSTPLNFYEALRLVPHRIDAPGGHNEHSDKWTNGRVRWSLTLCVSSSVAIPFLMFIMFCGSSRF